MDINKELNEIKALTNHSEELLRELAKQFTERRKTGNRFIKMSIISLLLSLTLLLAICASADIKEIENNGDKIKVITNCQNPYQCLREAPKVFQKRESATWG